MAPVSKGTKTQSNIVFILSDKLGYGEVGVYGGGILRGVNAPN
jgi:arylsulfatase A-like enzyme